MAVQWHPELGWENDELSQRLFTVVCEQVSTSCGSGRANRANRTCYQSLIHPLPEVVLTSMTNPPETLVQDRNLGLAG